MKGDLWSLPTLPSPLEWEYSQWKLQILSYQNFLLILILNQWSAARSVPPEHHTAVHTTTATRCPQPREHCDHTEVSMRENNVYGVSYHMPGHVPNMSWSALNPSLTIQWWTQQQLASDCSRHHYSNRKPSYYSRSLRYRFAYQWHHPTHLFTTEHTVKRLRHRIRRWPDTGYPTHPKPNKAAAQNQKQTRTVWSWTCTLQFSISAWRKQHNTGFAEA